MAHTTRLLFPFLFLGALLPAQTAAPAPTAEAPAVARPVDGALASAIVAEGLERSQAMSMLEEMCTQIGWRLTGSRNYQKAADWAAKKFESFGLQNVQKEPWGEWNLVWGRDAWVGRVTSPVQLEMYVATDAWTAGTNGLTKGALLRAPTDDDELAALGDRIKGAFVFRKRLSAEMRKKVEAAGIAGWVYRANDPNEKYPLRVRVFGNHRTAMGKMEDVPTVPEIAVRADHAEELEKLLGGKEPVQVEFDIQNRFEQGPIVLENVIAEIPGTEKPDEVVIVCGHLDSWHQAQGTTDNGTGTNTTMEAARILAAVGAKPKRTIRFCLWGGEEQGLLGSAAYVRKHRTEMEKVSAVFNHDTGTNWAAALGVTEPMLPFMEAVFAPVNELMKSPDEGHEGPVFKLNKVERIAGGGGSDHASFIAAGVPGLNWSLKGRSDYFGYTWHTQWDRMDVAIEEYQRHTATVIALAALGTANLDAMLDRSGVQRSEGRQAASYAAALFDGEMEGFKVTKLNQDGRGEKLGLKVGDVLKKVQGKEIQEMFEIFQVARDVEGDSVTFTFQRGEQMVDVKMLKSDLPARRRGGQGGQGGQGRQGGEAGGQRGGNATGGGGGN